MATPPSFRLSGMLHLIGILFLAMLAPATGFALSIREDLYITDGAVEAIALGQNTIYLGGSFKHVGPPTGGGVPIDAVTGQASTGFPKVTGSVEAIAPDGSGGWFVGGNFTYVGDAQRRNLAHILPDLSISPWSPDADSEVTALAVSGTTVYAGGLFSFVGSKSRSRIAAIDATSGNATAWNPAADGAVLSLAVSGTTIYVGGGFQNIGGQPRSFIAALDATTGLATSWDPHADSGVQTLAVEGTTIYAGGAFTSIGGQARNYIAALDPNTATATTWNPNADGGVLSLAVSGTTIYAGGLFHTVGGQTRNAVAALSATTGSATAWNPDADSPNGVVYSLALNGTVVYVAGWFTSIGGQVRNNIAALNATDGSATGWDPSAIGLVRALSVSGNSVYAGGVASIGAQTRNHIAALDIGTGAVTAWNPNSDSEVLALAVGGTTIYAGGYFTNIGGQARNCIAALDANTGLATGWNPNPNSQVFALAVNGGVVYAGGYFQFIGGRQRSYVAALDATTGNASDWNSLGNGPVQALALDGPTLYVGGELSLVALDATTGARKVWNPQVSSVNALAVGPSTVYVGAWNTVAAYDKTTGDPVWSQNLYLWYQDLETLEWRWGAGSANAVQVSGSLAYVGGIFEAIGPPSLVPPSPDWARYFLAGLDASSGNLVGAWNPNGLAVPPGLMIGDTFPMEGRVWSMALQGSTLYVGGDFTRIAGFPRSGIAALTDVEVSVPEPTLVARNGLGRISPNPTSDHVDIEFTLPEATHVRMGVFDLQGRLVARLADEPLPAGQHRASWSGRRTGGVRAGIYFIRFEAAGRNETKSFVLLD